MNAPSKPSGRVNLFDLERSALRDLVTLVESRATTEATAREACATTLASAEKELARARKQIALSRERDMGTLTSSYQQTQEKIAEQFATQSSAIDAELVSSRTRANQEGDAAEKEARTALQDARWTAESVFEAAEKRANDQREEAKRYAAKIEERIKLLWQSAEGPLARAMLVREDIEVPASRADVGVIVDPIQTIDERLTAAEADLATIRDSRGLRLAGMSGLFVFLVPLAVIGAIPSVFAEDKLIAVSVGALGALGLAALLHWIIRRNALRNANVRAREFAASLGRASEARIVHLKRADTEHARRMAEAAGDRDRSKANADRTLSPKIEQAIATRQSNIDQAVATHAKVTERLRQWRIDAITASNTHYATESKACTEKYDQSLSVAETAYNELVREANFGLAEVEKKLSIEWRDGQDRIGRALNKLRANGLEHFPDWDSPFWYNPPAAVKVPAGVRFGDFEVDLTKLPGGVPQDDPDDVPVLPVRLKLPAFLPFPDRCSLLLKAKDQGRARAVQSIQAIMLRLLTAIPPGKLRFTVIDPVGLGENFAAFMHLADYDEQMIGSRIWTEAQQIEKRLADTTAHMETVIQKYLRNQYKTIEDYNAQAGEVAEPFRVLIIANFPANFTLDACRRLVSIINSGPACGVYTLVTYDPKHPLPQGFNLSDIEQGSINLTWKDGAFVWKDPDFVRFPLTLELPPSLEETTRIVRLVGERSKNANRVEVPFDFVAPRAMEIWSGDSRHGLSVAIGRAGATKRQMFEVGKGTAQHALIAGKTGSGKSTLLHALIVNLAMQYSPDEVELYLIDFKKGVEFKAYAQHRLPHARAIAIESEREFGLSVLQRLDGVLKERGDLFREAGVNSLAEYREHLDRLSGAKSQEKLTEEAETVKIGVPSKFPSCPRIMLIVDEFQEFFVEDDKVAQECALLLDRLVRQGRAFGLHVLLGSQTLGGAFSLARSTIDQMAIRIALQCSDADAQLILSKDNAAARLLSRPGEAIYNNQNGLIEGNDLFQVVWLDDDKKDKILADVRERADQLGRAYTAPLVFEGNAPAIVDRNPELGKLISASTYPSGVRAPQAWLGDAVAIKGPTATSFRTIGGHNLLIVGQEGEAALAVTATTLISLAVQLPPDGVKFFVLDGTPEDDPQAGMLTRIAGVLPHSVRFVDRTDLGTALGAVSAEVTARQKNESTDRTPCFVFVFGAQRYRELRKDDDFGFSRRGERAATPSESLMTILKDGPTVNVFTILWADTPTNLGRVVDRAGMREFALRVLFQMGANDSSTLIDSPAASRLGRNRALYVTEESPQPEKFRPYGLPSDEWLAKIRHQLGTR